MRLQFLGCGDAFGSGGRFNTCFHVTTESTQFLVDCGASLMIAIRRFGVEPNAIETIFITHLHGDGIVTETVWEWRKWLGCRHASALLSPSSLSA